MSRALILYRNLWRTINKTFAGDNTAVTASRTELRNQFKANKNLTDPLQINTLLQDAEEANEFLKTSVVQATKSGCGSYSVSAEKAELMKEIQEDINKGNV
uniref:Complex 1 LYR protein domain-containing protein n=1 Tax=Polytomella parva TaxID=51329 RepID=A0A7S0ULM7_9CHLO|mmetsp:Transcript_13358/g.23649  ORF Transcript_13358/g.23649 Transcript_13358/m.23649 type:complete len:101 (+) Transcript_13358:41-343(+)